MANRTEKEWRRYWQELRRFIKEPKSGLLLDAEVDYDAEGNQLVTPGAVFKLTSGKLRRHFVSLWELYDHPEAFRTCVSALAAKAIEIRRRHRFDSVVTCTHTARELLNHIQPKVEEETKPPLIVSEFGHYPWMSSAELEARDFDSRKVLIFTDVMASGSLVRDMAARVLRTGGSVTAILSVVLCDSELGARVRPGEPVTFRIDDHGTEKPLEAPVYALTAYSLPDLPAAKIDVTQIRRIDFVSVFPEMIPPKDDAPPPLIPTATMHRQFAEAHALRFGLFQSDKRWYSLAIRVQSLLEKQGDSIWKDLRRHIPEEPVIVSTFKKDDLLFNHFVQERMRTEGQDADAFVLKREQGDSPHLHYALFRHTSRLTGRNIVLLRASAVTSEELRTLAALLVAQPVKSLTVICLVNRMGPYTLSFVRRIQQLITGAPTTQRSEPALFKFAPVYNLVDLRIEDLARMRERVHGVLEKFAATTEVVHFKHLIETFDQQMAPQSLNTHSFVSETKAASVPISGNDPARNDYFTLEHMAAAAVNQMVHTRSRSLLREGIAQATDPDLILHLAAIALTDLDYYRLSGELAKLTAAIRSRLKQVRSERFSREAASGNPKPGSGPDEELRTTIEYCLTLEATLLFAWGLLAHFDRPTEAGNALLLEVIFDDRDIADWHAHPRNLRYHFRDVRHYGLAAFLLHAAAPQASGRRARRERRENLIEGLRQRFDALRKFPGIKEMGFRKRKDLIVLDARIRDLMELLLEEFGAFSHKHLHQRIRYLQRDVLLDALQHNPLVTALDTLGNDYYDHLDNPGSVPHTDLQRHAREAHAAALTLAEVCSTTKRLARYASHVIAEQLRPEFDDPSGRNPARRKVRSLLRWIEEHGTDWPKSQSAAAEYSGLVAEVRKSIFDSTSSLHTVLKYFVVPLRETLLDAMRITNGRLRQFKLRDVWKSEIRRFEKETRKRAPETFVLIDPHLLHEVLLNLLTNVRHNLKGKLVKTRASFERSLRVSLTPTADLVPSGDLESADGWSLKIEVFHGAPVAEHRVRKTFDDHSERVRQFGGELSLSSQPGGQGSRAELKLLSRNQYERHNKTRPERR